MDELAVLFDNVNDLARSRRPVLIGVTGPVAVGKTTIAARIASQLGATVVSTDSFLMSNAWLSQRDLLMRKGFPESYDDALIEETLDRMRAGGYVELPVYSHATYDLVPGQVQRIEAADLFVIEGVTALQPAVRKRLDLGVYIDAPENVIRRWFVVRFLRLTEEACGDESSFYHGFSGLETAQVTAIAEGAWDGINAVNLHEHIAPTRKYADVVVTKGTNHEVVRVDMVER
jgi:type I pantothenate kinase